MNKGEFMKGIYVIIGFICVLKRQGFDFDNNSAMDLIEAVSDLAMTCNHDENVRGMLKEEIEKFTDYIDDVDLLFTGPIC